METLNWQHMIVEGLIVGLPTFGLLLRIYFSLKEFGLHRHQEKTGPLDAKGIVTSRAMNGD